MMQSRTFSLLYSFIFSTLLFSVSLVSVSALEPRTSEKKSQEIVSLIVRFDAIENIDAPLKKIAPLKKRSLLQESSPLKNVKKKRGFTTPQKEALSRLERTIVIDVPKKEKDAIIAQLKKKSAVEQVEENILFHAALFPADSSFDKQWGLHNDGSFLGNTDADIDAPEGWDIQQESSLPIAVVDSGVAMDHSDLNDAIWTNPNEIAGDGIDNDNNGYIDDVHGWDFVNNDNDPSDDHGHGTHAAGVIGAETGSSPTGIAGIVRNAEIVPLKTLNEDGEGTLVDTLAALEYIAVMNIPISNNSYGSSAGFSSDTLFDMLTVLENENHLFIAAAGNNNANNDTIPYYPASFPHTNIISVTATSYDDTLANFSNSGKTTVDLAAPGSSIYSTVPPEAASSSCTKCDSSGYKYFSGTSMATPFVTGSAALVWTKNASLSAEQVKTALLETGDTKTTLENTVTEKRLNLYNALTRAKNSPPTAILSINDADVFQNTTIVFEAKEALDSDADTLTYKWDFGDGNTSTAKKTSHRYTTAGTYTVTLTIDDGTWKETLTSTVIVHDRTITNVRLQKKYLRWDATRGIQKFRVQLRYKGKNKTSTIHVWKTKKEKRLAKKEILAALQEHPKKQKRENLRIRITGKTTQNNVKKSQSIKIPKKVFKKWKKSF